MSSGPLDQLEQTLERSIENVRQVRPCFESLCKIREQPLPKLFMEGSNSCVRLPASRSTRSHSEVAAGFFDLPRLFPQKILQTRW